MVTEFSLLHNPWKEIRAMKAKEALGTSHVRSTQTLTPWSSIFICHSASLWSENDQAGRNIVLSHLSVRPRSSVWSIARITLHNVTMYCGNEKQLGVSCVYMSWSHSEWQTGSGWAWSYRNKESTHWTSAASVMILTFFRSQGGQVLSVWAVLSVQTTLFVSLPSFLVAGQFDSFWFEELFKILGKLCNLFLFRVENMPANCYKHCVFCTVGTLFLLQLWCLLVSLTCIVVTVKHQHRHNI